MIFDEDSIIKEADELVISDFLECNYRIYGDYEINDGVVNINGDIDLKTKIKHLTNGMFRFGIVTGTFYAGGNYNLLTLEGAPRKCNDFDCTGCIKLKNLIGCPLEVSIIYCNYCDRLISLEGSPEEVIIFRCKGCKSLKDLNYLPKKITKVLDVSDCPKLTSLKGCPDEVISFYCDDCSGLKTLEGCPVKCDYFSCNRCDNLETLKGGPKIISGKLKCTDCPKLKPLDELDGLEKVGEMIK